MSLLLWFVVTSAKGRCAAAVLTRAVLDNGSVPGSGRIEDTLRCRIVVEVTEFDNDRTEARTGCHV